MPESIEARMRRVENVLGASPVPALREPGGGLLASVDRFHHEVTALGHEVATTVRRIDRLEATLGGVRKDLDAVQSELRHTTTVLGSVTESLRSLTAEIRHAEKSRPLPGGSGKSISVTRRGAAQLAGIATLIAALSSGVAAVIYAARGEVRTQQQTTGAPP